MSNSMPGPETKGNGAKRGARLRITAVRVISQGFFFGLFCFLVLVNTFGTEWFEKRGWPVNFFFHLDPLIAISTALSTHSLYKGLAWSLLILIPTLFLGRFFCGWICPYGSLHHFIGWALGSMKRSEQITKNTYRPFFYIKYGILIFLLAAAAGNLPLNAVRWSAGHKLLVLLIGLGMAVLGLTWLMQGKKGQSRGLFRRGVLTVLLLAAGYVGLCKWLSADMTRVTSLQIGWLDPKCLLHRSVTTAVLPMADWSLEKLYSETAQYQGSFWSGMILLALLAANLAMPRCFCRVLGPLGALLGAVSRFAFWRVERSRSRCTSCRLCVTHCEGGCEPDTNLRLSECVVCLNCLDSCPEEALEFGGVLSPVFAGDADPDVSEGIAAPAIQKRRAVLAAIAGAAAVPFMRLTGASLRNWQASVIRPPGSLPEEQFLQACLKCGQCMRICPTNVLQPAGAEAGVEGVWTPVLNNKIGKGCMQNCTACGQVCPTGAIRPISIERKRGLGEYASEGPIKLGTAFVDRGRCLPWAMDKPCGVCEEVCPISPKAIFLRVTEETLYHGVMPITAATGISITCAGQRWKEGAYSTGDHWVEIVGGTGASQRRRIAGNTAEQLTISAEEPFRPAPGADSTFVIKVRLPRPHVNPELCIGCGTCEHECPVSGLRAIRVTGENESRSKDRSLLLRS